MESGEEKFLGMNKTHLAYCVAIFMINSFLLTFLLGPVLITDSDYFRHLVYIPNEGAMLLRLREIQAIVFIFFLGYTIPTVLLLTLNKLVVVMQDMLCSKES